MSQDIVFWLIIFIFRIKILLKTVLNIRSDCEYRTKSMSKKISVCILLVYVLLWIYQFMRFYVIIRLIYYLTLKQYTDWKMIDV